MRRAKKIVYVSALLAVSVGLGALLFVSAAPAVGLRVAVNNTNIVELPEGAYKAVVRPVTVRYLDTRQAYSFSFTRLHWVNWGRATASASGRVEVCGDGADPCQHFAGTLKLTGLRRGFACGEPVGDRLYTRARMTADARRRASAELSSVEGC